MSMPILSIVARRNIDNGTWFPWVSSALPQHPLAGSGDAPAQERCGVALDSVSVRSVSAVRKPVALTCVEPGCGNLRVACRASKRRAGSCSILLWRYKPLARSE